MLPADLAATIKADFMVRVQDTRDTVRAAVQLHGPRVVTSVIAATVPEPVDRGTYKRTWYIEDTEEGATLYNNSPHAPVIEAGRRKGAKMPPVNLIAAWVRRKGIASGPEALGVAFVIARSISKRGQQGKWILKKSQIILDPLVLEAVAQSQKEKHKRAAKARAQARSAAKKSK